MTVFNFAPATKANRKLRLALAGPSGSGKTKTALLLAQALAHGERFAVIDTERETASLYSDDHPFDALNVHEFNPEDLPKMLAAAASRYPVVVIDSLSSFWSGSGGMLEQVDNAARRGYGGNNFGGWKEMRPVERAMIDALLAFPGHVIVTMRVKTEYVIEENERGKKVPRKVGLQPEQRGGIEYEFDVVGDIDLEHTMTVTKSRCSVLADAVIRKPDEQVALTLLDWLQSGVTTSDALDYLARATAPTLTYADARALYDEVKGRGLLNAAVTDDRGQPSTLGQVILDNGRAARIAEETAQRAAAAFEGADQEPVGAPS
jgi:energy-coupling factor transporter ATP-binding protein EcfA2